MRLRWATDVHLDHLRVRQDLEKFCDRLYTGLGRDDAVVLTGDLSTADQLPTHLRELDRRAPDGVRVLFVLGNHDYYGGYVDAVRGVVGDVVDRGTHLRYLGAPLAVTTRPEHRLAPDVAVVGVDGWADARAGNTATPVLMSDFRLIEDLADAMPDGAVLGWRRGVDRSRIHAKLRELADREAADLERQFDRVLAPGVRRCVVATHLPPWPGAAWHQGASSVPDWQTYFVSVAVGQAIDRVAAAHPRVRFAVLCGHTHGEGEYRPTPNVRCLTGAAEYGRPGVCATFDLAYDHGARPGDAELFT